MWDLIVSVPDHCLSFYFSSKHNPSLRIRQLQGSCYVYIIIFMRLVIVEQITLQVAFKPIDRCAVSNVRLCQLVCYSIILDLELKMACQSWLNVIWERAVDLELLTLVCLS